MKKTLSRTKTLAQQHPKKTVALGSIIATLVVVMNFWGDAYRVVCPFFSEPHKSACYASGRAAELDRAEPGGIAVLDGPADGGQP